MKSTIKTDVIILGAGAAGMMCAIEAAQRGRHVVVLDHANKAGKKILMSGGGRCNFTNYHIGFDNYLSANPHFCKSALSRYTQWHFIDWVKQHRIPFHEKTLGQLFCDNKSRDIVDMLLFELTQAKATLQLHTSITGVEGLSAHHFKVQTPTHNYHCESLVVATGGLSIPTMGATPFGYQLAEQFALNVLPTRAGLVPLTLHPEDKTRLSPLAGIGVASQVQTARALFAENVLFTHRGLSGPAILQASSYWLPGESITINLLPGKEIQAALQHAQQHTPRQQVKTLVSEWLPKRVVQTLLPESLANREIRRLQARELDDVVMQLSAWKIKPNGTEGYRTAEVTLGGVDTTQLSSKTMEATAWPGLYFIGEVVDVTGWLGGYNFQWAWSSGWAAGQVV